MVRKQAAFVIFAASGLRMFVVPDRHFFTRQRNEIFFDDWLGQSELQLLVHPLVHHFPADVVEVVRELKKGVICRLSFAPSRSYKLLQFGPALGGKLFGPIVGSNGA